MCILVFLFQFLWSLSPQSDIESMIHRGIGQQIKEEGPFHVDKMQNMTFSEFLVYLAFDGDEERMKAESRPFYRQLVAGLIYHQNDLLERSLLTEVVDNAIDATKGIKKAHISVCLDDNFFEVSNESEGVSFQVIDRIFLPYLSTKQSLEDIGRFGQGLKTVLALLIQGGDFFKMSFFDPQRKKRIHIELKVKEGVVISKEDPSYLDFIEVNVSEEDEETRSHLKHPTRIQVSSKQLTPSYLNKLAGHFKEGYFYYEDKNTKPQIMVTEKVDSKRHSRVVGHLEETHQVLQSQEGELEWAIEKFETKPKSNHVVFMLNGRAIFKIPSQHSYLLHLPSSLTLVTSKDQFVINQNFYDTFFSIFIRLASEVQSGEKHLKDVFSHLYEAINFLNEGPLVEFRMALNLYLAQNYPSLIKGQGGAFQSQLKDSSIDQDFHEIMEKISIHFGLISSQKQGVKTDDYGGNPTYEPQPFLQVIFYDVLKEVMGKERLTKQERKECLASRYFAQVCSQMSFAYKSLVDNSQDKKKTYLESGDRPCEGLRWPDYDTSSPQYHAMIDTLCSVWRKIVVEIYYPVKRQKNKKDEAFLNFLGSINEKIGPLQMKLKNSRKHAFKTKEEMGELPPFLDYIVPIEINKMELDREERIFYNRAENQAKPLNGLKELNEKYGKSEIVVNKLKNFKSLNIQPMTAITEVISNSVEAGAKNITVESGEMSSDKIAIKISDDGGGIDNPLSVLIPFQSTKSLADGLNFGWGLYQALSVFSEIMIVSRTKGKKISIYLNRTEKGEITYHYDIVEDETIEKTGTDVYLMSTFPHHYRINSYQLAHDFHQAFPIEPVQLDSFVWKGSNIFSGRAAQKTLFDPIFFSIDLFSDIPEIESNSEKIVSHLEQAGICIGGFIVKKIRPSELLAQIEQIVGKIDLPNRQVVLLRVRELLSLRRVFYRTRMDKSFVTRDGVASETLSNSVSTKLAHEYLNPKWTQKFSKSQDQKEKSRSAKFNWRGRIQGKVSGFVKETLSSLPHVEEKRSLVIGYSGLVSKNLEGSDMKLEEDVVLDFEKESVNLFFDVLEKNEKYDLYMRSYTLGFDRQEIDDFWEIVEYIEEVGGTLPEDTQSNKLADDLIGLIERRGWKDIVEISEAPSLSAVSLIVLVEVALRRENEKKGYKDQYAWTDNSLNFMKEKGLIETQEEIDLIEQYRRLSRKKQSELYWLMQMKMLKQKIEKKEGKKEDLQRLAEDLYPFILKGETSSSLPCFLNENDSLFKKWEALSLKEKRSIYDYAVKRYLRSLAPSKKEELNQIAEYEIHEGGTIEEGQKYNKLSTIDKERVHLLAQGKRLKRARQLGHLIAPFILNKEMTVVLPSFFKEKALYLKKLSQLPIEEQRLVLACIQEKIENKEKQKLSVQSTAKEEKGRRIEAQLSVKQEKWVKEIKEKYPLISLQLIPEPQRKRLNIELKKVEHQKEEDDDDDDLIVLELPKEDEVSVVTPSKDLAVLEHQKKDDLEQKKSSLEREGKGCSDFQIKESQPNKGRQSVQPSLRKEEEEKKQISTSKKRVDNLSSILSDKRRSQTLPAQLTSNEIVTSTALTESVELCETIKKEGVFQKLILFKNRIQKKDISQSA